MSAALWAALILYWDSNSARSLSISALSPNPFSMTFAPTPAKARAMPRPMPLVEPVTSATLLERFIVREL